jgi:hypothetical protein
MSEEKFYKLVPTKGKPDAAKLKVIKKIEKGK